MSRLPVTVLISADAEWEAVRHLYPQAACTPTPFGDAFDAELPCGRLRFFHGGWGKIAAAASTQYAIDRWRPALLINLGTCGGFAGQIAVGEVVLVERCLVYDIVEQMGDAEASLAHYTTTLPLSWLRPPYPIPVRPSLLISGDRDLLAEEVAALHRRYGAVAGDWESASIAYVAVRNGVRLLILRAVSDIVGAQGGEVYGNFDLYRRRSRHLMAMLIRSLPGWLRAAGLCPAPEHPAGKEG